MTATVMSEPAATESFWKRRVIAPILAQLRQGITPEKIALTVALGFVLGVFPILGSTTLLCGISAIALRLNQPVIQLVNYLAYPLQIALLIPFYQAGAIAFGGGRGALSISMLIESFRADFMTFLAEFGWIAVHGIAVWLLVAPVIAAAIYFALRPALRVLERRLPPA